MRGRTNIIHTAKGSMDINTEIKKMQVEKGSSINAGDFVSRIHIPAENVYLDGGLHRLCSVNHISGNLYVAVDFSTGTVASGTGRIVLFTYTDEIINVIYGYAEESIQNIIKIRDNLFIARVTNKSIFTFSVDTENNSIINITHFSVRSENNFYRLSNNVIMTYFTGIYSIRFEFIDISDHNNIHNINEKYIEYHIYSSNTFYSGTISYIGNDNQKLYFISTNKKKAGANQNQSYFHNCVDFIVVTLNEDYSSVVEFKIIKSYGTSYNIFSTAVETSSNGGMVFENNDIKYIGYIIYESVSNEEKSCTLYLYDTLSEEIIQSITPFPSDTYLLLNSLIDTSMSYTKYYANVKIDDNSWIILSISKNENKIIYTTWHYSTDGIMKFQKSVISEISNIGIDQYRPTFTHDNKLIFSSISPLTAPTYSLSCSFVNNSLKLGTYKNTITPYENHDCPDGIAKDSGEGGDQINVYVIPN